MIYKGKEELKKELEEKLGLGRVKTDELLAQHTTFEIGGPADFYFEAHNTDELLKAVKVARQLSVLYFILGGGSNLLVADKGFRGLIIRNKSHQIKILAMRGKITKAQGLEIGVDEVLLEADSGVPFNQLVRFTIEEGLGGLEAFLGLPGTIGGAVTGNAHWREKTIEDNVVEKKFFEKEVLLSATFSLRKEDKAILWQRAREAMAYRQTRQPLNLPSAGCIFKNIKKSEAARVGTPGLTTSTGFLLEAAGLKGYQIGQVQISPFHANFIVNLGGGKAADVLKLIDLAKGKVKEKFGIKLEEEIVKVGDF